MLPPLIVIALAACAIPAATALATQPKIDADTCTQLRLEQIKFRQSGIVDDMAKGPEWAKANLPPDRLREIEHYMALDEQVKFGCRDAKLSPEAEKASEAASRIEINSDADPTAPLARRGMRSSVRRPRSRQPPNSRRKREPRTRRAKAAASGGAEPRQSVADLQTASHRGAAPRAPSPRLTRPLRRHQRRRLRRHRSFRPSDLAKPWSTTLSPVAS